MLLLQPIITVLIAVIAVVVLSVLCRITQILTTTSHYPSGRPCNERR